VFFRKLCKFIAAPFKLLWKAISAPFRNRYVGYTVAGIALSAAWVYHAYFNPTSLFIELIAISCMSSVIARLLKIKGDGFGIDLINALTGAIAFTTSLVSVHGYTSENYH